MGLELESEREIYSYFFKLKKKKKENYHSSSSCVFCITPSLLISLMLKEHL
jgi:hypothetical protein